MTANNQDPFWIRCLPKVLRNLLEGRTSLLAAIHNSGWILFDKVLRLFLGLLVGAWVARYLGPSQYGELAYYIAFIALFQAVTGLGLDGIAVREMSHEKSRTHIVLGTVYRLRLYAGIACWFLAVITYGLIEGWGGSGIYIVGLVGASLVFQAADTIDLWFQEQSQSKRTVIAKTIAYIILNGAKVCLILMHAEMIAFVFLIAAESLLYAIALWLAYKGHPSDSVWLHSKAEAKKLLLESWPYILSGLAVMIYMRIDQIMIKNMLDDGSLGIFSAILPIANAWNVIPVTIVTSIAPFMAKKYLEDKAAFQNTLLWMFRLLWLIAFCAIGFTTLISPYLIPAIFGDHYLDSIMILNIYVWTFLPISLGVGQGIWMLNERRSKLAMTQTVTGALASVAINLLLIPRFSVMGAAFAAILAQLISTVFINLLLARKLFFMQLGIRPPQWVK